MGSLISSRECVSYHFSYLKLAKPHAFLTSVSIFGPAPKVLGHTGFWREHVHVTVTHLTWEMNTAKPDSETSHQ